MNQDGDRSSDGSASEASGDVCKSDPMNLAVAKEQLTKSLSKVTYRSSSVDNLNIPDFSKEVSVSFTNDAISVPLTAKSLIALTINKTNEPQTEQNEINEDIDRQIEAIMSGLQRIEDNQRSEQYWRTLVSFLWPILLLFASRSFDDGTFNFVSLFCCVVLGILSLRLL